ncbi:unnamed protein product [Rotaria sp. Silwood2]|nr:unnamed protein product [Rotaria sp. Silwood2]CAF4202373.1 unnamed protein product [Rotaria sp. Silwood2]
MLPNISIHQLINQNENEWFTCADINSKQEIVCGTDQGIIYQTQLPSNGNSSTYKQLIGHTKLISDICYYDPNGCYILSCSADTDIRLWRSFSSNSVTIYRSHLSPVWCLSVHYKSDRFASGSMDKTVRLWTPDRLNILRTFIYHSDDINTITFHPNGKYLASGSNDGLIILWAIEQAQPARILKSLSNIEQLTFTSDGNHLISISHNNEQKSDRISIWDIRSANEKYLIENIPSHRRLLKSCQIQNTHKFVTGFNKSFLFFDINNQQEKNDIFRSEFSNEYIQRLIHFSSNEPNKLIAIMTTIRQRRKPVIPIEIVRDLDAFVKVENDFKQPTTTGGTISIITIIVVICLSIVHIATFQSNTLKYDYDVDWDHDSKLKINIDMTVAMSCSLIGSDVLDVTNTNPLESGKLDEEDTWFELSPRQQRAFNSLQAGSKLIRQQYHAIHDLLWLSGHTIEQLPEREVKLDRKPDACRLHGTLEVNKLAGNFHIILGKFDKDDFDFDLSHSHSLNLHGLSQIKSISFSFFGAHAHISPMGVQALNFSHRIDHLSFGLPTPGLIQPLNGDLKIANTGSQIFQYFLEVVPTVVQTSYSNVETYQYAVTEKTRTIDHNSGSHGIPGIFIRYEISPLKITVKEILQSYWLLLIEIGGIFGGVFATSGMIHSLISIVYDALSKQCSNAQLREDIRKKSTNGDQTTTVAIGITPESSSIM